MMPLTVRMMMIDHVCQTCVNCRYSWDKRGRWWASCELTGHEVSTLMCGCPYWDGGWPPFGRRIGGAETAEETLITTGGI